MRFNRINIRSNSGKLFSKLSAIIMSIVGFIMSTPFWVSVFMSQGHHYMSLLDIVFIISMLVGMPMMIMGIVSLLVGKAGASAASYNDHDVSRMRHVIERDGR